MYESLHEASIAAASEFALVPEAGGQTSPSCRFDDIDPGAAAAAVAGPDRKAAAAVERPFEPIEGCQFGRREAEIHPTDGFLATIGAQAGVFGVTDRKRAEVANLGPAARRVSPDHGLNHGGNLEGAVAE